MLAISEWYPALGSYTFPTVFIQLSPAQIDALVNGQQDGKPVEDVLKRLNLVIKSLPGSSFVHADVCAPTDSDTYARSAATKTGRRAWDMLTESDKVRAAFGDGRTQRLGVHPYRRMDPVKEFRMFVKGRELRGMSQKKLDRHYRRLEGRKTFIWNEANRLIDEIAPLLPADDLTLDVYLTSDPSLMLLDFDVWGTPTDPLLFRNWEHDWENEQLGLRLIPPPIQLKGDVEVSF